MFAKIFPPREITFIRRRYFHFSRVLLSKDICNCHAGFLIIHSFMQQTPTEPSLCGGTGGTIGNLDEVPALLFLPRKQMFIK